MATKKKRRRKSKKALHTKRRLVLGFMLLVLVVGVLHNSTFFAPKGFTGAAPSDPKAYFEAMSPYATYIGTRYGVWPSVALAQSALESDYGRSGLSRDYHNYFGIKELRPEKGVRLHTQEFFGGEETTIQDAFRVYNDVSESFIDYGKMLSSMHQYRGVLEAATYQEAAYALQKGGYATDPNYPEKIISLIETYDLSRYDYGVKPS